VVADLALIEKIQCGTHANFMPHSISVTTTFISLHQSMKLPPHSHSNPSGFRTQRDPDCAMARQCQSLNDEDPTQVWKRHSRGRFFYSRHARDHQMQAPDASHRTHRVGGETLPLPATNRAREGVVNRCPILNNGASDPQET
jgi:hypothetical protein